jgi:hypothetical protein
MLLAEYAPPHTKHLPVDPLRLCIPPLAQERIGQTARSIQRVRMLLAKYAPRHFEQNSFGFNLEIFFKNL